MLFLALLAMNSSMNPVLPEPKHWSYQRTPPMGWNSWDCFGTTITESQVKAQADAMAKELKPFGWTFLTVDIQWYEPNAKGHDYQPGARLEMDDHSRLIPAVNKFPSSANGKGFKPLADYVHKKGLKFGIHIMRGIPRQAVNANTPIIGTELQAKDVANPKSICAWNPDMYGVDATLAGGQAYYNSLFKMYASWGVDLVKVDDIARPYDAVQKAEIEAIRRAIDQSGRPIVLSLSPGDTPIEQGAHVSEHANMWRISDDFWDQWHPLYGMFGRLDKWTPFRHNGAWPDADMLPFGIVEFNRPTRFTQDEQTLCMTLWSIARSPLILGADMTRLDPFTLNLLTNSEVLGVNQSSLNNRQLWRKGDLVAWVADVSGSHDKYLALFNAQSNEMPYDLSQAAYRSPVIRGAPGAEVAEISAALGQTHKLALVVTDGGDNNYYDQVAWLEPTLSGPKGTIKLTDLKWTKATAGWREARVNKTVDDHVINGIGTHSVSIIEYDVPDGFDTFRAKGVLTAGSEGKGSVEFVVLTDKASRPVPDHSLVSVSISDLGLDGDVTVRDLWNKKDLGLFSGTFGQSLPLHGAGLYRVTLRGEKE